MVLADLHVHSQFSDGSLSVAELVDFYGSRGFGAIAITDHLCEDRTFLGSFAKFLRFTLTEETFPTYLATIEKEAERAWRKYRMVVIPGFEITKNSISNHRSAHILGLGISKFVAADIPVTEICDEIHRQGGLAIAAHPVSTRKLEAQTYYLWNRREELKHYFDAWEVASGPMLFNEVLHSGLKMIATSDFHRPSQINSWKTVLNCEREVDAIFDAIREQNLTFRVYADTVSDLSGKASAIVSSNRAMR